MQIVGSITPPEQRMDIRRADEDEVLRQESRPVKHFNRALGELLDRMKATLAHHRGAGLAAVQVGVPKRIILVSDGDDLHELINPEIIAKRGSEEAFEGCLSLPGIMGEVNRPTEVRLQAYDRQGKKTWLDAQGWTARVVCHEMDHLDGGIFVDKSERLVRMPAYTQMRLVFMGTPEFSVLPLQRLLEENCQVVGVVTAPDRPRGRGQKERPSPVKHVALEHNIPVMQPGSSADEPELIQHLEWLEPDLIVTVAYGRILRSDILNLPNKGCVNVHPSLLPKYRGAAPLQRQLLDGVQESGVTTFWMDEGTDSGPIILQRTVEVSGEENAGDLHDRLAEVGADVLIESLDAIARDEAKCRQQDDELATYAPKITKEELQIDWRRPAEDVVNQIRAFSPKPGAWTKWKGQRLKILRAEYDCAPAGGEPGQIADLAHDGIRISTPAGTCVVTRVQPAGSRAMDVRDFINGYDLEVGDILGE